MTRPHGVAGSACGLVPGGHLCWAFESRAEFRARAAEYIADGLAAGQWVEYVGAGDAGALRTELAGIDGLGELVDRGRVGVCPVGDFYEFVDGGDVVDPVAAVAKRVAATEKALAEGYTGFRAVVDATAVAHTPEQRAAFACFEYLIDRKMSVAPVTALCAYDATELGEATAELACLHPFVSPGSTRFQLYAERGVEFALAGELDLVTDPAFGTTLARVLPLSADVELVIDCDDLQFIDHRRLLALTALAPGREVVLRGARHGLARLAELLPVGSLRLEPQQ